MKQTAVEWFYIEMENLRVKAEITNMDGNDFIIAKVKLLNQAKAMEKEQKIKFAFDFYYDFSNKLGVPFNLISENRTNAEKYYEQKFKSE